MTKPLGYYTSPEVVAALTEQHGDHLEQLTAGDKAVILAVIGTYFHGKLETIEEYADEEPYTELTDGWNDYPLMCSDAAEDAIHALNSCDDRALLGLADALVDYLRGA